MRRSSDATSSAPRPHPSPSATSSPTYSGRLGHLSGSEMIRSTHAESPWVQATGGGNRFANQVISHRSLIDFFSTESPELQRLRKAVATTRDDSPFESDPPGLRDALIAEYLHK